MALRILFLQGHPSPFARELGRGLAARGHFVRRVNLSLGDSLFWRGPDCIAYRGPFEAWEGWVEALMKADEITHLIYFADRQPYHVAAQRAARRVGVVCVSHEFGYLRPDWMIVEEGGQSVFSHFPAELEQVRALSHGLPDPDMTPRHRHPFWIEAVREVAYHLGNAMMSPLQPKFRADRVDHPVVEYLSYLPRHLQGWWRSRIAEGQIRDILQAGAGFHLLALQMAGDYQIRANSAIDDYPAAIVGVIRSHARHGPPGGRLVVKLHPMDNGRIGWARIVQKAAAEAGNADRVVFLDGGDLGQLLSRARGCVVVNSTVGLHALQAGCPVKCLGFATYDMPGLTHQGALDQFWTSPETAHPDDVRALVRLMAAAIHVRGSFHSPSGRREAVVGFIKLLENGLARRFGAHVSPPPRLAAARKAGLDCAPWD